MADNLATIEGVSHDEAKKSRIRTLLAELDEKFPEGEQQIGDITANVYKIVEDARKKASIIEIMEDLNETGNVTKKQMTYADAATAYALLRKDNGFR